MIAINTKQLRSRMMEVIDLLLKGQEIELSYRSKKVVIVNKNKQPSLKKNLRSASKRLSKYEISSKIKKAKDFREIMNSYYD